MEPIAVIGIGCRFPQANNPQAFWQLLRNGVDAIAPMPEDRWRVDDYYHPHPQTPGKMNVRRGGFLDEIDGFDADFFGMTAEEVEHSDPQQRLFLEVAWEALEHAGIMPSKLAGSQTGVFTGLCTIDYHRLLYKNFDCIGPHSSTGTTMCITANRLSYLLNLQGPSIAIDAACSSSLVTVHLACQSLRSQESDLCIAGGINLILSPDSTISSSQTGLLSGEGRCKSFDANADGYARGEGCGVVILKRLSDAMKDGDRILALIRGSAVNHNGLSNNLSAPNGLAQQAVIRQALKNAKVQPSEISYVDAHAVGTGIGDAIEFKALQSVLREGRQPGHTCAIGSVKTNIGHLEAAAGISALIKVILALQHEEIPPHLHLQQINPYISPDDLFYIPTKLRQWSKKEKNRLAGVSAFGFGGTNAHIVLEEAPILKGQKLPEEVAPIDRPLHLITLSAKNQLALRQLARKYERFLASESQVNVADLAFTTNTGRNHFKHRLCVTAESSYELRQQLTAFSNDNITKKLLTGEVKGRKKPKLAWFFPGESGEYQAREYQFYETQPAYRRAISCCDRVLQSYFSQPLFELLSPKVAANLFILDKTILNQCALFATQYAIAQLWQSWGIKPKAVMGYGVGEYVAATIAEVLELEAALKLVIRRAYLIGVTQPSAAEIEAFLQAVRETVYHKPQISVVSGFTQELAGEDVATPEYWYRHWQQPEKVPDIIEALSSYPILLSMGGRSAFLPRKDTLYLFSLSNSNDHWQEILYSLGELYVRGVKIDWSGFDRDYIRRRISLPTYPFQRQRYWFKTPQAETEAQFPQDTDNFYPERKSLTKTVNQTSTIKAIGVSHYLRVELPRKKLR